MNRIIVLLAAAGLMLAGCSKMGELEENLMGDELQPMVYIHLAESERAARNASNSFGLETFHRLYAASGGEDVVFSPLSLSLALSMAAEGAAGDTYDQFARVIGWGDATQEAVGSYYKKMIDGLVTADPSVLFTSANSIWAAKSLPLKKEYQSLLEKNYAAESYQVDFSLSATLDRINTWCSEKTDGKIPKMLDFLNPRTSMMLINALLFKAPWSFTWDVLRNRRFTTASGSRTTKDYLYVEKELGYGDWGDFETACISYGNGAYQMVVVLPKEGKSLAELLPELKPEAFSYALESAKAKLYLPKWSSSYSTGDLLVDVLKAQGLSLPFDPVRADFSGISTQSQYIDKVIQKVKIDVTEKGTEFAAVTVVVGGVTSAGPVSRKEVTLDLNRPFAYAIREVSTGTILLLGTLSR